MVSLSRKRRNVLLALAALGAGGYLSYRFYNSASLARRRRKVIQFFHSLASVLEAFAQGSDCAKVVWKDFHTFVLSDEDEVPQSMKQLMKVSQTREFRIAVISLTSSFVQGLCEKVDVPEGGGSVGSVGVAFYDESTRTKDSLKKKKPPSKLNVELGSGESSRDGFHSHKNLRNGSDLEADGCGRFVEEFDVKIELLTGSNLSMPNSPCNVDDQQHFEVEREEEGCAAGEDVCAMNVVPRKMSKSKSEGLSERLLGKLFTESGRGFASVVVATAARSLVLSVLESMQEMKRQEEGEVFDRERWTNDVRKSRGNKADEFDGSERGIGKKFCSQESSKRRPVVPTSQSNFQEGLLDFACSSRGRSLIADCIESFVGTAVAIYLDKTRDVNFFEDMVASLVNPCHQEPVKQLLTSVCNGAVETLIRTSHEVLSVGSLGPSRFDPDGSIAGVHSSFCLDKNNDITEIVHGEQIDAANYQRKLEMADKSESLSTSGSSDSLQIHNALESTGGGSILAPAMFQKKNGKLFETADKLAVGSQGWIDGISKTLAIPSNRKLLVDVAGAMSSEAVRSFFEVFIMRFFQTLHARLRGILIEGHPAERSTKEDQQLRSSSVEVAKATTARALIIMTSCLAVCLHCLVDVNVLQ